MANNDRAGFREVIQFGEANPSEFKTSEIMEFLQEQGMTSGAATGTIRRACECRLLRKVGRARYQYCGNNNEAPCNSSVAAVKQILQNAAAQINSSVKLSDISSPEEATELLRITNELKKLIDSIE